MEGLGPLRVVLLEAGLETVPRELWGHPQVRRSAARYGVEPGEMLLDKSLHYHAMAGLSRKWKRGRPDIVHTTLLVLQESILARKGFLEVYIHVIDGRVFALRPDVRIPKNYERFRGLMAQLLRLGKVPPEGEPLIWKVADRLADFTRRFGGIILLWEKGVEARPAYVAVRAMATGLPLGIGAFPRGDFERSTLRKAVEAYRLAGGEPMAAWSVACRVVAAAEDVLGLV